MRRCVVILFRILCRVRGEGVEAALPAAVGEQGEGGGGCASHHLRAEKVPGLFHLIAFLFYFLPFHISRWGIGAVGIFHLSTMILMCGLNLLCSSETSNNSVVQD